ncbi:MAG: HD domain-containing protein [Spirochaetales bacterium]|nr:HD domain-containing protein [Spirochaetales bacterium]
MHKIQVPEILKKISVAFKSAGFSVYLVGGAVRDHFLGKEHDDLDIATDATPDQVARLFKRIIPTGIEHGTVTIIVGDRHIECTTFRTEEGYTDGRRPDKIEFAPTIEEDLSRRDFTMNAIAAALPEGIITDPFNGIQDIRHGIIRTVGDAKERFSEDGLRPMRAVRFAAQLGFSIERKTLDAIGPALQVTAQVAIERIRDEFIKIALAPKPSIGLRCMEETGLLRLIFPELQNCRGIEQKGLHAFDVLDHIYFACDSAPPAIELRLAALFHDIGKPAVRAIGPGGEWTFHNHETESARIAENILKRLKFPVKLTQQTTHLIRQHMFNYQSEWTDAAVRRFIVRVGEESIQDLFSLRRADTAAITGTPAHALKHTMLDEFDDRIQKIQKEKHAFALKDLSVNGGDLVSLGIGPGPVTGKILNELLETVLDDPELNEKQRLLEIARLIYQKKFNQEMPVG